MRRFLRQLAYFSVLLLLVGCVVNDNLVFDASPLNVEIRSTPKKVGADEVEYKRSEITLPISKAEVTTNVTNGLAVITGNQYENGKTNQNITKIAVFDLVTDRILWSGTGKYSVHGLYPNLLVLKKGSSGPFMGLDPTSTRPIFNMTIEPRLLKGMEDVLIASSADSVICLESATGEKNWSCKGFPFTWEKHYYIIDRTLVIYGDYIQAINVDSVKQWNRPMSNTKVHNAEAMAINAGLCLLSACAGAMTGTYYQTDYVEPRITHSLGSMPVFTDDAVIYADATTINMCDLQSGDVMWTYDFSAENQPATILLSLKGNQLLVTFTGKKSTDNEVDTIAEPKFKLIDIKSGEALWNLNKSRLDHPRDILWAKDRTYLLHKGELQMYDEADTLMAATGCSLEWGEFYSFEVSKDDLLTVYCSEGIVELDPVTLQEISFKEKPAEQMTEYLSQYPTYEALKRVDKTGEMPGTIGRDGITDIKKEISVNKINFTMTYEGDF